MQTNPESAAVEAVATVCLITYRNMPHFIGAEIQLHGGLDVRKGDKLYPQSALDALRGEVERARIAGIDACDKLTMLWQKDIDRADAAERRVAELEAFLRILWEEYEHAAEYMGEGCLGVDPYRRSQFEALTGADPK